MNSRALARQQRRWQLQQRSAQLRDSLTQHAHAVVPALIWAERTRKGTLWLKRHPWVPLGLGFVLLLRRPRALLRWTTRAWALWKTVQRAKGVLGGLGRWWPAR